MMWWSVRVGGLSPAQARARSNLWVWVCVWAGPAWARGAVGTGTSALALMPGGGLVVRDFGNDGRVQFFATPDACPLSVSRGWWP